MSGMFNSIRIPKKREVRKRKVQKQVSHIAGIMMELNDNKAGMKGLDKDKINAVIRAASEGSKFQKHQEVREKRIQLRIESQKKLLASLKESQLAEAKDQMNQLETELENRRDLSRTIVHIDMDAFYAAVEMRDSPKLRSVPIAVGSSSMLSTSNYLARRFGVRAAMPGFIAKKLCSDLIIVPCDFEKYTAVSEEIREIFAEYDPNYLAASLDEAYLDITEFLDSRKTSYSNIHEKETTFKRHRFDGSCVCRLPRMPSEVQTESDNIERSELICDKCGKTQVIFSDLVNFKWSTEETVKEIRFRIEQKTGLTASAGIASNSMLAKVCSDINKPNGQYYLKPDFNVIREFVKNLLVRKVPGIGGVTESLLKALEIETCANLYEKRELLPLLFTPASANFLFRVALGIGSSDMSEKSSGCRKSISIERSFSELDDVSALVDMCRMLSSKLASDLKERQLQGKNVTIKMKTDQFEVMTRSVTLDRYISSENEIFAATKPLLLAEVDRLMPTKLKLRLMGVRLSSFGDSDLDEKNQLKRFLRPTSTSSSSTAKKPKIVSFIEKIGMNKQVAPLLELVSIIQILEMLTKFGSDSESDSSCSAGHLSDKEDLILSRLNEPTTSSSKLCSVPEEMKEPSEDLIYYCYICNCRQMKCSSLKELNDHMDQCLSRQAVRELVKSQNEELSRSSELPTTSLKQIPLKGISPKTPVKTKPKKITPKKGKEAKNLAASRKIDSFFSSH